MAREKDAWTIPHSLDETVVDEEQSYRWLKFGDKGRKRKYNSDNPGLSN